MKQFKSLLALPLAVILILIGLLLPQYVSRIQDRQLAEQVSTYEIGAVVLQSVSQVEGSLRLITGEHSLVEMSRGNRLNSDGVYQAALEFLAFSETYGLPLLQSSIMKHGEIPLLAVSADGSATAVIWKCQIYDEGRRGIQLVIDDASGKMLSFTLTDSSDEVLKNPLSQQLPADAVAKLAAEYYGLTLTSELSWASSDKTSVFSSWPLVMEPETGEPITFYLSALADTISFNAPDAIETVRRK